MNSKDADISKATPVMKQYLELKRENEKCILLFRIGDFYETFFEDAKILADVCSIILTSRLLGAFGIVPMAGIPKKSFDIYLKKLLNANYRVARAEQYKDEDGSWKRKVVRIYSKATVFEEEYLESGSNSYLLALYKGVKNYSIAYCDSSDGSFYATAGTRDEIASEIIKIAPQEIMLHKDALLFDFKEILGTAPVRVCPEYFNPKEKEEGFYKDAMVCADAIINYLRHTQKDYMPSLDKIKKYSISNFMSMDLHTRLALELSRNTNNFKKHGTLFSFIDKTKTPMGRRLLKEWMTAPVYNLDIITHRENLIFELCNNENLRKLVANFLEDLCDILRLGAKISNKTIGVKELVTLSYSLEKIKTLYEIEKLFNSHLFKIDHGELNILYDFSQIIKRTLDFESGDLIFEKIPIKDGANPKIDLLRSNLAKLNDELKCLVEIEKQTVSSDVISNWGANIGYYFEILTKNSTKISQNSYIKQNLKNKTRYSTPKLDSLAEKIYATKYQIEAAEVELLNNLRSYSKELTEKIRNFAKNLAFLDSIYSLSDIALEANLKKPVFSSGKVFKIKDGFHPLLKKPVPNDTILDLKDNYLNILTGANMSGKSTYLKQNAIICILAQMGSFVPAKCAEISLCDRLFFHSIIPDSLQKGESTFMAEMRNIASILNNLTIDSIILMDEPVKGTTSNEAAALCYSILKHILEKTPARTIIATHFFEISKLEETYRGANSLFIDYAKRRIAKGVFENSKAIEVALDAGIPMSVAQDAKEYLAK